MLGLNKDPSHFPSLSPIVAVVRRRVWWQLYYVDTVISLAAGIPPIIDDEMCDVKPITQLKDSLIGTETGLAYERDLALGVIDQDVCDKLNGTFSTSRVGIAGVWTAAKYQEMGKSFPG